MTKPEIDVDAIERQLDYLLVGTTGCSHELARICKQLLEYIKLADQARRDGVK